uniref:C-type lectin domain-containing protein n=1 Tax=Amphilophus citrinellus TaxID=61819 RepID=A0A3Q0S6D8_AMPCI
SKEMLKQLLLRLSLSYMKKDCPDGWFQFGHQCFSFISSAKTWIEAQIFCQFDGGNLASIHSYEENRFVQTLTRGNTHDFPETWIGGTDAIHVWKYFYLII